MNNTVKSMRVLLVDRTPALVRAWRRAFEDVERLVAAPTMRVPESVSHTVNAYLAFRQMRIAYKHASEPARIPSSHAVDAVHAASRGA